MGECPDCGVRVSFWAYEHHCDLSAVRAQARADERAKIARWVRERVCRPGTNALHESQDIADAIERGEHNT